MNFNEIDEARKLLGLGEIATLKEIKAAYRRLAKIHHPDKHHGPDAGETEMMKRLNGAYKLLTDYCSDYKYSFRQEDISSGHAEEEDYKKWRDKWSF